MSYTALYRKFRPDNFKDVKGQDHIVTTLKNQIQADRIGHAYLFCGTRGTGKTSIAKLFAKTVNCEHPVDGSPCGECASCKSIAAGNSMNVIEIDAASNNGVDEVRSLIDKVKYTCMWLTYMCICIKTGGASVGGCGGGGEALGKLKNKFTNNHYIVF